MGNYRHIHPEQKKLITVLSCTMKPAEIASKTHFSLRTVHRILKTWRETGEVSRSEGQRGRRRILNPYEVTYLEGLVEHTPDIYLRELQNALFKAFEVDVDERTISRSLSRRGFTRKMVTRISRERDEEARNTYQAIVGDNYRPDALVFLDEAACNRHTGKRRVAWARKGDRARRHDFFVRGTRYSILPAISLDGILHLDIMTRSWTKEEFRKYIEVLLDNMNPFPQRNSVLVMDNASVHHFDGLREIVEARGMRLLYLPAYSPDFNPIEEGFSSMKAWIRRNRDFVVGELMDEPTCNPIGMLWEAVFSTMTPVSIEGWFRDCGYIVY